MITLAGLETSTIKRAALSLRWPMSAALLLLLAASTLAYLHFFNQQHTLVHNDLIGRQFATRAALHGVSPYTPEMPESTGILVRSRTATGSVLCLVGSPAP